ncbi:MAG: hypothetical protein U5L02_06445 [Rheinheimera sp.]|nr:hypothetical protein [Rheinheimera sp.]
MELSALLASGGMKSVQTGWVETTTPTMVAAADIAAARNATGEDQVYVDITISAVDTTKCVLDVVGGFGYFANALYGDTPSYKPRFLSAIGDGGSAGGATHQITARLLNSTTLRLSSDRPSVQDSMLTRKLFGCRWTVVEGK